MENKRKSQFEQLKELSSFDAPPYVPSVYKESGLTNVMNDDGIIVQKSVIILHDPVEDMKLYKDSDFRVANLLASGLDPNQFQSLRPSSSSLDSAEFSQGVFDAAAAAAAADDAAAAAAAAASVEE